MKESIRTLIYVGIAAVFVAGAVVVAHLTTPETPEIYARTGEPFHEEFDPGRVARLELSAIPKDETEVQKFVVAKSKGLWRLQSYHGYPAEAKDRLAKTAAFAMGVIRESLAGQSKKQHARFGVVNPDDEDITDPNSAGKRIRMLDSEGNVLVDLIIGKDLERDESSTAKLDDEDRIDDPGTLHYVRRADEEETYLARIGRNVVSTEFSQWIEQDLLKLDPEELRTLEIDNYSTEEKRIMTKNGPVRQVIPTNREQVKVTRESGFASWTMDGLDETTESLKAATINELLSVLDQMTILGVAPRFAVDGKSPLTGDMKFQPPQSVGKNPNALIDVLQRLAGDLDERGFSLQLAQKDLQQIVNGNTPVDVQMLSDHGDITVATEHGVVYHLHFGKEVIGTEKEIRIGGKPKPDKPDPKEQKQAASKKDNKPEPDNKDGTEDDGTRRYVLIRVEYDEAYYVDKPEKPTKPQPPPRPVVAAKKPRDRTQPVVAPRPAPRADRHAPVVAARPDPLARFYIENEEYLEKQRQYETDLETYETDMTTFRENVKQAKERVRRLNERFTGWYYVISTQNLKQLTLRRADLVGPKQKGAPSPKRNLPFKLPGMR